MSEQLRRALRWPLQEEADPDKGAGGGGDKGKKKDGGDAELGTVEDQARRMGWVPEADFRGDKAKWTDAATFLKNGLESLPILRERNRTLQKANEELSKSAAEFKKMSDTAFERAYTKAKRELEEKIETAAETGGEEGKKAAKAAAKDLAELEGEKAQRDAAAKDDPVFDAWELQNDWYKDPELREEAEVEAFRLRKKGSKLEGEAFLEAVKEAVKKKHPEKFGNPRRSQPGGTERPNAGGEETLTRGKKGWEQLPAEAKEAGERYIKQKLYKDKAAYAEAYWAQA